MATRSDFNDDFEATVDGEEQHRLSVFLRQGDRAFQTYATERPGESSTSISRRTHGRRRRRTEPYGGYDATTSTNADRWSSVSLPRH